MGIVTESKKGKEEKEEDSGKIDFSKLVVKKM
jgi:hypothetical protein